MQWVRNGDRERVAENGAGFLEGHAVLPEIGARLAVIPFKRQAHDFILITIIFPGKRL